MTEDNFIVLQFAEARQPYFKEQRGDGYIRFGENNDYPDYLLELYNKSAKHGAITRNKAKYIIGNGWNDTAFVREFGLNISSPKVTLDIETFGGSYLEVIWSKYGRTIVSINHYDYLKFRTNKDNTLFWYKNDWSDNKENPVVIPAFDPKSPTKRQILFIKEYRPGLKAYPLPGWISCINYIESDIEVSKHTLGNAANGFKPSKLITLTNGEPTPDEKKTITKRVEKKWSGAGGSPFIIEFVNGKERQTLIQDLGTSDLTKEDFSRVDELIQNNIFAGHEVTSPSLFGIAVPGKLGTSTELKDSYEIFNNTYVNDKQRFLEAIFNMLARYAGEHEELKIQPIDPLGIRISDTLIDKYAPAEWVFEKLGIDPTKYSPVKIDGQPAAAGLVSEDMVNDHIKNMTPQQHAEMVRIIRQFKRGILNEAQAKLLLKRQCAMTDEDATIMLSIEEEPIEVSMSADDAIKVFSEYGEAKGNFSILKSKRRADEDSDFQAFAEVSQTESNILDLISKDKRITPEVIATTLKISVKRVNEIINSAISKGLIEVTESKIGKGDTSNVVIERKLTAPISEIVEKVKPTTKSLMIRYTYDWLPEIPQDERNTSAHPSRDFCKELMRLDRVYSRADIEQISARLGYSVFDRRGGWWNDNGNIKEHCRHGWFSTVLIRK